MSMGAQTPALHVENLDVQFIDRGKALTVLAVENLDIAAGTSLALTGPSGCGKSTLLYALAGLLRPSHGKVRWGGLDLSALNEAARDAWRRNNIGFVFQDFELLAELPALQNVLVPATFAHFRIDASARYRAQDLLDRFGVPARSGPVGQLSRGERQRVALARALLFDPPIILADEPTASLDAKSGALVVSALAELARAEGRTVVAATHDPAVIAGFGGQLRLERGHPVAFAEAGP